MVKYGIAPVIKQAFEEVFKAPFIVKILLAELGQKPGKDIFLVINYDGTFEEGPHCAVLAASKSVEQDMLAYLRKSGTMQLPLDQAVGTALQAWAVGDRSQRNALAAENVEGRSRVSAPDAAGLYAYVREAVAEKTLEGAVLDRTQPGSSKYRALTAEELGRLLPQDIKRARCNAMLKRIFGLETEYGLLVHQDRPDHSPTCSRTKSVIMSSTFSGRACWICIIAGTMSRRGTAVS